LLNYSDTHITCKKKEIEICFKNQNITMGVICEKLGAYSKYQNIKVALSFPIN